MNKINFHFFQVQQLRALSSISNITDNFRPVQGLNGRKIFVRKPSAIDSSENVDSNQPGYSDSSRPADWDTTGGSSVNLATTLFVFSATVVSKWLFAYNN